MYHLVWVYVKRHYYFECHNYWPMEIAYGRWAWRQTFNNVKGKKAGWCYQDGNMEILAPIIFCG